MYLSVVLIFALPLHSKSSQMHINVKSRNFGAEGFKIGDIECVPLIKFKCLIYNKNVKSKNKVLRGLNSESKL